MVKASSQIERELSLLQQRTQELETSLEPLYEGYLKALSEASGRQLVMAAFHLCTQAYPSKFLSLSLQQRNQLQQDIQKLSSGLYDQLIKQREKAKKESRRPPKNNGLAFLQRLLEAKSSGAAIVATDGSHESLLEKLSALGLSDEEDESDSSDWPDSDVPGAEDDGLDGWTTSEGESLEDWSASSQVDSLADGSSAKAGDRNESQGSEQESEQRLYDGIDIFETGFEAAAERQEAEESLDSQSAGDRSSEGTSSETSEPDFELEVPPAEERLVLTEEDDLLAALEGLARRSAEAEETAVEESLAPVHLVRQQMLLEKGIRKVLERVSEQANERLQQANIMPRFPKALLAAASGPREMGEPVNSVPNVFKVAVRVMHGEALMDAEPDLRDRSRENEGRRAGRRPRKQSKESDRRRRERRRLRSPRMEMPREMVEIDALPELSMISMQLSEVEFSDHTVSAWRSRIRQEFENLKKLGSKYQKTQRSLETAQAEDAWRASWTPVRSNVADVERTEEG